MTTIEWILSLAVVVGLWLTALWYFFIDSPREAREEQRRREWDRALVANEIARWREASTRTYERQGIRRNR